MTTEPRVRRAAALAGIDSDACVRGYLDAWDRKPRGEDSYSYRHGYRNGQADKGDRPIDEPMRELAADVVASWRQP